MNTDKKMLSLTVRGCVFNLVSYGCLALLTTSCLTFNEQKHIDGIIRDYHTDKIISNATIKLPRIGLEIKTDTLGYFRIPKEHNFQISKKRKFKKKNCLACLTVNDIMEVSVSGKTIEVPLSENIKFYKILIKNGDKGIKLDTFKVADMHYHVTMKPHNEFAQNMYFKKRYR